MRKEKQKRIRSLVAQIVANDRAYYEEGIPKISDSEYDKMKRMLAKLAPDHSLLSKVGSFSGSATATKRATFMGSLGNLKNLKQLRSWVFKRKKYRLSDRSPYVVSLKLDGVALDLFYVKGDLIGGYTRGNGTTGEDVTEACLHIPSIPKKLDKPVTTNIRGEAFIHWTDFMEVNADLHVPFKLPRALVAGAIKLKDKKAIKERKLSFLAWEEVNTKKETEIKMFKRLKNLGVPVVPHIIAPYFDQECIDAWIEARKDSDIPTDGVVISLNDLAVIRQLGMTSGRPNAKTAYKFPPVQKWSTVVSIEASVGRTGVITPVVWFYPVILDGSEVEKASGYNYPDMLSKNIAVGGRVLVQKACDIIPEIVKGKTELKPPRVPVQCPRCSSTLKSEETFLYCTDDSCPAKMERRFKYFVDGMGVKDFGPVAIARMQRNFCLENFSDLYSLSESELHAICASSTIGNKVFKSLHENKKVPLSQMIEAMGMNSIGKELSKKVAKALGKIDLSDCDANSIERKLKRAKISGKIMLPRIAEEVYNNRNEIIALYDIIDTEKENNSGGRFNGMLFCITGALSESKKKVAKKITDEGGEYKSSFTSKTHFLIAEDKNGSTTKLTKAKNTNCKIISEKDFNDMLKGMEV